MAARKTPRPPAAAKASAIKGITVPCDCAACQQRIERDRRYPSPKRIIEAVVEVYEHRRRRGALGKLTRQQWGFRLRVGGEIITWGEGYANRSEAEERGNRLADGVYRRRQA